jgi:hypothetical protein
MPVEGLGLADFVAAAGVLLPTKQRGSMTNKQFRELRQSAPAATRAALDRAAQLHELYESGAIRAEEVRDSLTGATRLKFYKTLANTETVTTTAVVDGEETEVELLVSAESADEYREVAERERAWRAFVYDATGKQPEELAGAQESHELPDPTSDDPEATVTMQVPLLDSLRTRFREEAS